MTVNDPRLVARAQDHLFMFLRALHAQGVSVPANKQRDFLAGIELLAPSTIGQLYWVGAATLVSAEADRHVYDAVFQRFFGAAADVLVMTDEPAGEAADEEDRDDETAAAGGENAGEDLVVGPAGGSGLEASRLSPEAVRRFAATGAAAHETMRRIRRELPAAVPAVRSRRRRPGGRRHRLDLRAVYLASRRTQGEFVRLHWSRRPPRQRRVLLLIDVSGSMKRYSPDHLRFAHSVVATCDRAEVFTFGTRLTRVTAVLRDPDVDAALSALAQVVLDADGGTMIGDSLETFLANARFVTMARGALVLVLSDGLERGDCTAMTAATRRLARLGHQLSWWSPLACHPGYRPLTRGMSLVLPELDSLTGVRDLDTALIAVRDGFARTPGTRREAHV
ncbi:VWA domain-containing protein [Actinomadura darangshiensis]|uniref:VWA domain-containing protein n=1 Tax=Actinomadura darangshiensis TaxID=705336 RepID=A0A4R5A6K4_9ACTN|nr:VWA domain-containing protein [Actinomadura darangshiensis]TDD67571.1 VWA domain-containing protein [Actinomadura darangshiensis]